MDNTLTSRKMHSYFNILFILLCAVLLSSCSHVARKDGPPNFYVDETKVPNAKPKHEALAKYGNMPSYRVFGQRYYTMKSCKGFEQVGVASWYGTMFHARRTSSGERYNMLGMTAAHKTLPLPTYVEVTNLKNKRKIIVKVNDRGPFASNRIIDLSYVAAKKLGMLGHGTTLVKIKAIDPLTYGKPLLLARKTHPSSRQVYASRFRTPARQAKQSVYLQVGAFRNRQPAEKLRARLVTTLDEPISISKGKFYRIHIGPIRDVATANRITKRLHGMAPNVRVMPTSTGF